MDFSTKLRMMRARKGVSQLELEKMTRIPNTYISLMETGKMQPNPEWEKQIREALGWGEAEEQAFGLLEGQVAQEVPCPQSV